jgi:hypothetical protein
MTPNDPEPTPDDSELLHAERELTITEMTRLRQLGEKTWLAMGRIIKHQAGLTYAMAEPADFSSCVQEHLTAIQRSAMVAANVFTCPECGLLLKDRGVPVATSILLERRRLAEMWMLVEQATDDEQRAEAARRFRTALGL